MSKHVLLNAILVMLLLASCSDLRMYVPNTNPVPLFKNKGQTYTDMSISLSNVPNLYLGYALTHSIACYAGNYSDYYTDMRLYYDGYEDSYSRSYSNGYLLGLGYYLNSSRSPWFRLEGYAEMMYGKYQYQKFYRDPRYGLDKNASLKGDYYRPSLTFNIAFSHKFFNMGISNRLGFLCFNQSDLSGGNNSILAGIQDGLKKEPCKPLIDSGAFLLMGAKNIKLKFQVSISMLNGNHYGGQEVMRRFDKKDPNVTIGLVYTPVIYK